MPQAKLNLTPGINTQATQTANEGSWSSCNLIRWKDGYLEKMGGWQRMTATQLAGLSRGLHAYQDSDGHDYLISGSEDALQVFDGTTVYTLSLYGETHDLEVPWLVSTLIAPTTYSVVDADAAVTTGDTVHLDIPAQVDTITLPTGSYLVSAGTGSGNYSISATIAASGNDSGGEPPQFGTISTNSSIVGVFLLAHGYSGGDTFNVELATVVGGITLFGPYVVQTDAPFGPNTDNFFIDAGVKPGFIDNAYENQNSDGDPLGRVSYETPIPVGTNNWSIDNFGSAMIACYQNGPLLVWNPPVANLAATGVPTAPSIMRGLFTAMPQAQVIAFGADVGGLQDPLLVRFSDVGNYTNWTASAVNQAGSYRLSRGSGIIGGIQAPQTTLLWTDIDLWSMQYVGTPFVYSFNIVQTGCGLIAQRARCALFGQTYWMSQKQFFTYGSGGVSVIPCPVWDEVFGDLDEDNLDIIWAESNAGFGEIMFFFASESGGTGGIDKYAKYNVFSQLWDYGSLERTAGIDQSVFGSPIMIDANRRIQQHEIGYDADDAAMTGVFAESGFIDLGEGDFMQAILEIIPDFKWFGENGSVTLKLFCKNYPADNGVLNGPYTINSSTRFISPRVRARQIAFRIEWAPSRGFFSRLGATRYLGKPSGMRP